MPSLITAGMASIRASRENRGSQPWSNKTTPTTLTGLNIPELHLRNKNLFYMEKMEVQALP